MNVCAVDDCARSVYVKKRGLCRPHYWWQWKHGSLDRYIERPAEVSCVKCGESFAPATVQAKYCSAACKQRAAWEARKNSDAYEEAKARARRQYTPRPRTPKPRAACTESECDVDTYARGLCRKHYMRTRPRTPDKPQAIECSACGTVAERMPGGHKPKYGYTCSAACRRKLQYGERSELPSEHWARWYGRTSTWTPPKPEPARFISGRCDECDTPFVTTRNGDPGIYCSNRCSKRVGRRARRAREHNAPGTFRYSQVMQQYAQQGYACSYCHNPAQGLPDPEHVTPLSRGGRNDMSNIVAACRSCNADKGDLTLTEWRADRERRNLPVVDTTLNGPAYRHLFIEQPSTEAWRNRAA